MEQRVPTLPYTITLPLWKRVCMLIFSALFVAGALSGVYTTYKTDTQTAFLLGAAGAFFLWCFFVLLKAPKVILSADEQGITMHGMKKEMERKFAWDTLIRFEEVIGPQRSKFLAIESSDKSYLETIGPVLSIAKAFDSKLVSDGGRADIYLPGSSIGNIKKIIADLTMLRDRYAKKPLPTTETV